MKQLLQIKKENDEQEIIFIPLPLQIYKYLEILKRKSITFVKDEVYQTTYYIGDSFVHVINSSGKFNTTFYYADGVLIAEKDKDGKKKYYHPDHLGSTSLITNSSRDIIEETFYLPFGEVLEGGSESRYGYNSKEKDSTNLNYYGARYYKATQGQFVQPDSLLPDIYDPQQLNRYAYVLNNPYKYVDPSGEIVVTISGGIPSFQNAEDINPSFIDLADKFDDGIPVGHFSTSVKYGEIRDYIGSQSSNEPVAIIGYSWGGSKALDYSTRLEQEGIKVDALITVDAYKPNIRSSSETSGINLNLYQTKAYLNFIKGSPKNNMFNIDVGSINPDRSYTHRNILKDSYTQESILDIINGLHRVRKQSLSNPDLNNKESSKPYGSGVSQRPGPDGVIYGYGSRPANSSK